MSRLFIGTIAVSLLVSSAATVAAQEPVRLSETERLTVPAPVLDPWAHERPSSSPTLKALSGSYVVLQGLDLYSTSAALKAGAREVNPVMKTSLSNMMLLKAGIGVSTYFVVKKMARNNRKGAIVTMAILNGVTAAVVANNMKNARR